MATIDRPDPRALPPLEAGQRLDQPTFHARYAAMPPQTRAELVGGVVCMPSPLRNDHGTSSHTVGYWLGHYQRFTRGVQGSENVTAILSALSEPQPDCVLRIPETLGGLSHIDSDGYLTGPPELVVEVARSSRSLDLGVKKGDYCRAGVPEYLVIELEPNRVHWFVLRQRRYVTSSAGSDGTFRCRVFPGLWLDPRALFAGDLDGLCAVLDRGLATPEHAAFAARLAAP